MTFSSIVAIIGGIVTAGCAIAGAIAGIRARRAQERRDEEIKRAEHQEVLDRIRERRAAQREARMRVAYTPALTPTTNEIHHFYHPMGQQQPVEYYPQSTYQQCQSNYYSNQNQYMNPGYAYGYSYKDPVYRGEIEIGNRSKIQMGGYNPYQYNSYNYYPQANYAYAV